jgi:hypothetical protein
MPNGVRGLAVDDGRWSRPASGMRFAKNPLGILKRAWRGDVSFQSLSAVRPAAARRHFLPAVRPALVFLALPRLTYGPARHYPSASTASTSRSAVADSHDAPIGAETFPLMGEKLVLRTPSAFVRPG